MGDTIQKRFDANWLAAAPKAVQAICTMSQGIEERGEPALTLSQSGAALVDLNIVVFGWSPYWVHLGRTNCGIPYVGSLAGLAADPSGVASTGQTQQWQFPPWDQSKFPPHVLPTVQIDTTDDDGTLKRLQQLYPIPAPAVPVVTPTAVNPIGLAWGLLRDVTAPDGSIYKQCPVFNYTGPLNAGVDGEYYTSATGQRYLLQVTRGLMGDSKLWFLLPAAVKQ